MAATVMEIIQLRRTLWLVVSQMAEKTVAVDEMACSPLWRMKATRMEDGRMQLEATTLPEPTEEQLKVLAETLEGSRAGVGDAMNHTELRDHPPAYVEKCLKGLVIRQPDGYWVNAAFARTTDGTPGAN